MRRKDHLTPHPALKIPSLLDRKLLRLAAAAESLAVAPDASLFLCQRCETILQPGSNCSIRIEKNNAKRRRKHNKCSNLTQNVVAYYCHYCSCRNIKRGTPKGHMKVLYGTEFVSKLKSVGVEDGKECENKISPLPTGNRLTIDTPAIPPSTTGEDQNIDTRAIPPTGDISVVDGPVFSSPRTKDILNINAPATPSTLSVQTLSRSQKMKLLSNKQTGPASVEERVGDIPTVDAPATPPTMTGITLLDSKRRKRKKPSSKNQTEPESSAPTTYGDKTVGMSKRKRNRKSWTSLKEIAQRDEERGKQNVAVLAIPFSL
ncbi:uncharacterized protein LOC120092350 isoform X2 [Benincasa hispida]|uniref:uncharacterized protein LOC120092350 isoform X2 n=1 Tax=Benincasa hispida TaxID=102211 RepID=UPI0018FF9FC3|nr:uncharacterized protein LOC120092350 isoform X2 [Benincasa hispida]